ALPIPLPLLPLYRRAVPQLSPTHGEQCTTVQNPLSVAGPEDQSMAATRPERPASPLALRLFGPSEGDLHAQPLPRLHSRHLASRGGAPPLALIPHPHGPTAPRPGWRVPPRPARPEGPPPPTRLHPLAPRRGVLGPEAHRLCAAAPDPLGPELAGAVVGVVAF